MRIFRRNEDAVSPVIGVILMVAITVILAAVIAAFVFGLGGSQVKTPQASLSAVTASSATKNITISHSGGDSIDLNKVKAIIEQGTNRSTFSLLNSTSSQILSVGDKLVIHRDDPPAVAVNGVIGTDQSYPSGNDNFTLASGLVTVTLIDTDSNQQIASIKATVT
jgi:flagellin-like protein